MPSTIAIDVDEVLGAFVPALCKYHNDKYGTSLTLSDFCSYNFCEVWGGTRQQAVDKVHDFFKTDYFKQIELIPRAQAAIATLKQHGFNLVVVTSRQLIIEQMTREWIDRNFPKDTFSAIAFGNQFGKQGVKTSKKELCHKLGACVLIDDSLGYVKEVAVSGIHALLFDLDGSYPWNRSESLPKGVTRVTNWDMAVEQLIKLSTP